MIIGAHVSTAGGIWTAPERGAQLRCEAIQLFLKNNMQWFGKPYTAQEIARYVDALARNQFSMVFAHAGYLINLAAPSGKVRTKSIRSLIQEVQLAESLGMPFVVVHPGSHLGEGKERGVKRAAQALDEVFRVTKHSPVVIALENTAGQGSSLGSSLEEIAEIIHRCSFPERLAVCLDTAHLFQAGYPIHEPRGYSQLLNRIEQLFDKRRVVAWHLNDSRTGLGSRVDRHESIGKGKIGLSAFQFLLKDQIWTNTPGCIETPKGDDLQEDLYNLNLLRTLRDCRDS